MPNNLMPRRFLRWLMLCGVLACGLIDGLVELLALQRHRLRPGRGRGV